MTDVTQGVMKMHKLYCAITGINLPFQMSHVTPWEYFCSRFSEQDLKVVVRFINEKKKNGDNVRAFTFRNFISGPMSLDWFAEDLAEARARYKFPAPDPNRVSVLRATGRPAESERPVMTPAQIMEQHQVMADSLRAFRETL